MTIEDVIDRINDLGVVASDVKEYQFLEKKFIENFNNEYTIIEKPVIINTTNTDNSNIDSIDSINVFTAEKGDLINFCLKYDKRLKEIDSAMPLVISKELNNLGLDRSLMVTAYWKNGNIEILNILQHYITIRKSL